MGECRVSVLIASKGRPEELSDLIEQLDRQSQKPHSVVVSVTGPKDLPEINLPGEVAIVTGSAGLCAQRNRAIDLIVGECDVIAFFDDDYLPSRRAIEGISKLFVTNPEVVGANGVLLDDGIGSGGISVSRAKQLLDEYDGYLSEKSETLWDLNAGLYGCNMAIRAAAIGDQRFDEALPLYGWQEDVDFSFRVKGNGKLVKSDSFCGVHRGVSKGRVSGLKFGYSQIVNPYYLSKKGTMRRRYAIKLAVKNFIANHVRALVPEPWVDRWGRVRGNWLGIGHILRGTATPARILGLK